MSYFLLKSIVIYGAEYHNRGLSIHTCDGIPARSDEWAEETSALRVGYAGL